jgi:hypothetical protein
MDTRSWAAFGSVWVLCAIMAGIVAGERGRRFWLWFFFGLLTGPIGLYLALKSPEIVPPELAQTCPHCGKSIRKTLRKCPYCHRDIVKEPDRAMKAGRQAAAAIFLLRKAAQKSTAAVRAEQERRKSAARSREPGAGSQQTK